MPGNILTSEKHFFLGKENKSIYCVEYLPEHNKNRNTGVILCKPLWGERIRTHRVFSNLARLLRKEGFSVLTCDYFGDGNSGGDTLDLSYSSMVEDILSLKSYLVEKYRIQEVVLLGFRMGATCGMGAAPRIEHLRSMILIEPILSPIEYLKEGLRSNLSSQMALYKKIIKTREVLIEEIKNGAPVNMDGFLIGRGLWDSFEQISPFKVDGCFNGPVLILSLVDKGKAGTQYSDLSSKYANGRVEIIEKEFYWHEWKKNVTNPPVLFDRIRDELSLSGNTVTKARS
jgi:alpha/beta superfamily hydrolase